MTDRAGEAVRRIKREVSVYRAVASDPRCPALSRFFLGAALAYALSPVDLIPDFIPVIGQLDDLIIVPGLIALAIRSIPRELLAEHRIRCNQALDSVEL